MPRIASPAGLRPVSCLAASFDFPREVLDLSHPLTGLAVIQLAEQLMAGYGGDALQLAKRRAAQLFEQGSADRFADWNLVILALEEMVREP
jgi:hypothetical protein